MRRAIELRGWLKWIIYTLLLINFGYYFWEEWTIAQHAFRNGGTFIQWLSAFAVSLDEGSWFALLLLFELETHAIPDEKFTPRLEKVLHVARLICYVVLAHTIYAYSAYVVDLERKVTVLPEVSSLCQLADQDKSFTSNMAYTTIDAQNCAQLSQATEFYRVIMESIVTDSEGLAIEKQLGWVDLIEALVWLLIIFTIEFEVRLQSREIAGGPLIRAMNTAKVVLYSLLLLAAAYWAARGLWVYVWDELLWMAGFAVIELNVLEWRDELLDEGEENPALDAGAGAVSLVAPASRDQAQLG